jgi:hypothetical protein
MKFFKKVITLFKFFGHYTEKYTKYFIDFLNFKKLLKYFFQIKKDYQLKYFYKDQKKYLK